MLVWHWLTKDAAGFFTLLLVIVGAIQAFLFVWQLRLIRGSLHEAQRTSTVAKETAEAAKSQAESAKLQLRAYVSVTGVKVLFPTGEWQPNIRLTFKNCGRTPARELENRFGCAYGIVSNPSFKDFQQSVSYYDLGPEQDKTTTALIPQAIWNAFKGALAAGAVKFFVFGEIHYRDVFGDMHYTGYRLELSPDAEGIKEDSFVFCPEGNESN
jgi:hypothetical protein